jgi:hypothetical protein
MGADCGLATGSAGGKGGKGEGRKSLLFLEKKKQKNFYPFGAGSLNRTSQVTKVFLLLFFQKKKILPTTCLP